MNKTNKEKNDRQGGETLFKENYDRLFRYVRSRLANDADAQELTQEAYLRLIRISRKELIKHPQAYLYRIASNLVSELFGKELSPAQREDEKALDEMSTSDVSVEESAERTRRLQKLDKALNELPPKCKAVLILRTHKGMTSKETAECLGISVSMVKKYMSKGIAHCRKRMRWSMKQV